MFYSKRNIVAPAFRMLAVMLGATMLYGALPAAAAAGGLEDLHHFVSTFQSARGSFVQSVTEPSKKVTQSSGDFVFARPGKFRWTYLKPYNQVLVADGKTLTVYDADLNQATVRKLGDALGATPAAILFGDNRLEDNFDLKEFPQADGLDWVEARPKSHDTTFSSIEIGFRGDQLAAMKIADALGQTTRLEFSNVVSNAAVAADAFHFVPPKGADILDN
jgi:outer membrane lipoprotein carrier protein